MTELEVLTNNQEHFIEQSILEDNQ